MFDMPRHAFEWLAQRFSLGGSGRDERQEKGKPMADIQIERKQGFAWWWIVLGLVVLGLIAWMLLGRGDRTRDTATPATMEQPAPAVQEPGIGTQGVATHPAVQEFVASCGDASGQMDLDHAHTSQCVRRLVAAAGEIMRDPALSGLDVQTEMQLATETADRLEQSSVEADHSGMARDAFASITTVLERIQQQVGTTAPDAAALRNSVQSVQPTVPLLEQRAAVQDFFRRAGEIVSRLAEQPATA
jgi:hypothetical protein